MSPSEASAEIERLERRNEAQRKLSVIAVGAACQHAEHIVQIEPNAKRWAFCAAHGFPVKDSVTGRWIVSTDLEYFTGDTAQDAVDLAMAHCGMKVTP